MGDGVTTLNVGNPWSRMDVADLVGAVAHGDTIEQIAAFLMRAEEEVVAKARELELHHVFAIMHLTIPGSQPSPARCGPARLPSGIYAR